MNKKTVLKIKKAINFQEGVAEQRRFMKAIKKQYNNLNNLERKSLLLELNKTFEGKSIK
tara:strand:- start:107 stop:283 length:177 start_codon:yes stop_codon:yes gene_type:complete